MPSYVKINDIGDKAERDRIVDKLLALRAQLDGQIPAKTATDTLLLATWNIRRFTDNRRVESLYYLAEIINRFDLVAIQEVTSNLDGLHKLMDLLGHNWDYIVTDSTEGGEGMGERMAFVYDRCKVFFKKMAGEIVLPPKSLIGGELQFARTPYSVAFQAGWFKFILTTVHIIYGSGMKDDPKRVAEIKAIAEFINRRAAKEGANYILLGDFNIFKHSDATMKALLDQDFYIPNEIRENPTVLGAGKFYDQIAFKLRIDDNMMVFTEGRQRAGAFNFTETVYPPSEVDVYKRYFEPKNTENKTADQIKTYYMNTWRTNQISDHLPLWIELKIDFSNQYLKRINNPPLPKR